MTSYHVIYSGADAAPGAWAQDREAEGWHGVSVPDHLWVAGVPIGHLWVTLAQMAAATSRIRLGCGFANNLARSPVEFAQAALTLNTMSGGRVDAGLGAGWDEPEAAACGLPFPDGGERSQRLAEALTIARALFRDGRCTLAGRWYSVDVPSIGPAVGGGGGDAPPRLVTAATGRVTIGRVINLVDVLELKAPGFSVPGKGPMDATAVARLDRDQLRAGIDAARELRPDVVLGTFVPFGCGDHPLVRRIRDRLGESVFARFFGEPAAVADAVRDFGVLGYARLQLGAVTPESPSLLATALLGTPK